MILLNTINDDDGNDHETATIFKRYKFPSMNNFYNFFQISFSMLSPNYSATLKSITNSFSALFFSKCSAYAQLENGRISCFIQWRILSAVAQLPN